MLRSNVIEPSISPWNSPVLFVNKKMVDKEGNTIPERRMCVDLQAVAKAVAVAKTMAKGVRQYFAFSTKEGHYQFKVLPFGWVNSPFYFLRFTQTCIANQAKDCCRAYIDDLVIYLKTKKEHFQHIRKVLDIVCSANVRLKMSKCSFFTEEMKYLGHVITKEGIQKDPKKLEAIQKVRRPKNQKEL